MATRTSRHNRVRVQRAHRVHLRSKGSAERPRLSIFRSNKSIYVQLIDDTKGVTLAHASSKEVSAKTGKTEVAKQVGTLVAKRATEAGVRKVIFDRGAYRYHGRVKALAESARAGGLQF